MPRLLRNRKLMAGAAFVLFLVAVALWPEAGDGGDAGRAVRLFCAVPLALALSTLRTVEQGEDTLRAGVTPKVSRSTVAGIVAQAPAAAASNQALVALLRRCEGGN